jgi:hypothetical protein
MRFSTLIFFALLFCFNAESDVGAQQFKIESQIYINGEDQPSSSNVTMFSDGLVIDFQTKGTQAHEVTILQPKQHQTILLDRLRRMKLVLDDVQLIKMADALRRETAQDKAAGFLVNERFEETILFDNRTATLKSPSIEYTVRGSRPTDLKVFPIYSNFIDAFTRLQVSDPHAFSPFPRMRLNETIRKVGWIPSAVTVTFEPNQLMKHGLTASSKHTYISELSSADQAQIAEIKNEWLNFELVDLYEFRHLKKPTFGERMAGRNESPTAQNEQAPLR